jgi:hypothetical protein
LFEARLHAPICVFTMPIRLFTVRRSRRLRATRDREREDRRIVNTRIGGW